jgi:rRNA-processing protein FCF1
VVDTNVWIHLHHAGLLDEAAALPYELACPDTVAAELEEPSGVSLVAGRATVIPLGADGVARVSVLAQRYPKPSPTDLAALVLAEELKCVLVTGDRPLCTAARAEGVTVHGVLWVLDGLVAAGAVEPERAADGVEAMLTRGAHLPDDECSSRLVRWRRR